MKPNICTSSATLPPIQVVPAGPPRTYQGIAWTMLPGVRVLADASPLPALPLAMVSAHVLECTLKAYLSRSGNDKRVKEKDIRHNLAALWTLACSEGLQVQVEPPQWVTCLSKLHDTPYFLRYSTGVHGMSTPAPEPMATELAALVEQVERQLHP